MTKAEEYSFRMYQRNAKRIARQLYPISVISALDRAKTEPEIIRIMKTARENLPD